MKVFLAVGFLLGLCGVVGLIGWQGYDSVAASFAALGWGLALLPIAYLPFLTLAALSWRLLLQRGTAPSRLILTHAMWVGSSVDTLLPFGSLGGELVKVQLLVRARVGGANAGASVILDKTVQAISLVLWGLVGAALLVNIEADGNLLSATILTLMLLSLGIAGFVWVQMAGSATFVAKRLQGARPTRSWTGLVDNANRLDAAVRSGVRDYRRLPLSCGLRLAARATLSAEVWIAAVLMGADISFVDAVMLKSLTGVLRGIVFFVPGAVGIQEGGFVVLGLLLGMPPDVMLAVSLATRARELIVFLPGLLAWHDWTIGTRKA